MDAVPAALVTTTQCVEKMVVLVVDVVKVGSSTWARAWSVAWINTTARAASARRVM